MLSLVEAKRSQLDQLLPDCDVEVFCSYSTFNGQGGFVLTHELAERIAGSGVDVVFDLYALDENEN